MLITPEIKMPKALGLRLAGFAAAAMLLAGCQTDNYMNNTVALDDYHDRHPIVLADAPTTLDVFLDKRGGLDASTLADIRGFVQRYGQYGVGKIVLLAPAGGGPEARGGVAAVRRALAADGLRGTISYGSYRVADVNLAAPIKVAFRGLKAEVASRCGQWPTDLASGDSLEGWKNTTYWNYGCATQSMIAAQVNDPRDFVRAEALGPADVEMQLRAINAVRQGNDPGTNWKIQNTDIGQVGMGGGG
jgi:pilus assembly protein CpaD